MGWLSHDTGGARHVRELATILGRIAVTSGIWYNHSLAIHQRRSGRMRLFLWAITAPLWVPLKVLYDFMFGTGPTVYEYDPDHEDFTEETTYDD